MKQAWLVLLLSAMALNVATAARASSACASVLTGDQLRELDVMVFPSHPYSPHLGEAIDGEAAQGAVKRLTAAEIEKLRGAIARPFVGAVRSVASQDDIAPLKTWLKSNPSAELPAWESK